MWPPIVGPRVAGFIQSFGHLGRSVAFWEMPSSFGHDWVSVSLVQWLLSTLPSLVALLSAILGRDEWVTVAVVSVDQERPGFLLALGSTGSYSELVYPKIRSGKELVPFPT